MQYCRRQLRSIIRLGKSALSFKRLFSRWDAASLVAQRPHLMRVRMWCADVALVGWFDAIEADAVALAAHEGKVFGVAPAQRHRGASGRASREFGARQIVSVPELLGEHPALVRHLLERGDEGERVATGRQFVVAALAGEDRPGAADAGAVVGVPSSFCP